VPPFQKFSCLSHDVFSENNVSQDSNSAAEAGAALPRRRVEGKPGSPGSTQCPDEMSSGLPQRRGAHEHQVQGNSSQLLAWPAELGQARKMKAGGSVCRAQPAGSRLLVF